MTNKQWIPKNKVSGKLKKNTDIIRLDIQDWGGNVHSRIKGSGGDKRIGVAILDKVIDSFNLSADDISKIRQELNQTTDNNTKKFPRPFSNEWKKQK